MGQTGVVILPARACELINQIFTPLSEYFKPGLAPSLNLGLIVPSQFALMMRPQFSPPTIYMRQTGAYNVPHCCEKSYGVITPTVITAKRRSRAAFLVRAH